MASASEVTKLKKLSWRAFQALRPRTPRARGMRVIALRRMNTMMGISIFLSLCFLPASQKGEGVIQVTLEGRAGDLSICMHTIGVFSRQTNRLW